MKIIITANSSWNIYNFRMRIIEFFLSKNHKVIIVAPKDKYTKKLIEIGCEFYEIKIKQKGINPIQDILLFFNYINCFKKLKPDVILSFTIKPNIYANLANSFFFKTSIINNVSGLGTTFIKRDILTLVASTLYKLSFIFSDHIFFQNKDDLELFLKKRLIKNTSCSVIPGSGVDTDFFKINRKKNKGINFIFVGRIIADKGVIEFLKAAKKITKKYNNIYFKLVGELNTENKTSLDISDLSKYLSKNIQYLGVAKNVKEVLEENDILVLPSYREGLSRSLLEAASMELPIITTNVPGCKDVVIDNYNGLLCKVRCENNLYLKIKQMINFSENQRLEMGRNGRKFVKQKFNVGLVIKNYNDIILKLKKV